jgi:hypothetical protein
MNPNQWNVCYEFLYKYSLLLLSILTLGFI